MRRARVSPWLIALQLLLATVVAAYAAQRHDEHRADRDQARLAAQIEPALGALTSQTVGRLDDLSAIASQAGRVDGPRFQAVARRCSTSPHWTVWRSPGAARAARPSSSHGPATSACAAATTSPPSPPSGPR